MMPRGGWEPDLLCELLTVVRVGVEKSQLITLVFLVQLH